MNSTLDELKLREALARKGYERFMSLLLFVGLFFVAGFLWLKFDPRILGLVDCGRLDAAWMNECSKHQSFEQCESNLGALRGVHCR
jgi:hypothetical protein